MQIKRVHESLVTLADDRVWVERGPKPMRAKATAELLDDSRTAPHYKVGGADRLGRPIEEGKDFDYLDWNAPVENYGWYVYERRPREVFDHEPTGYVKMKGDKPVMKIEEHLEEVGIFDSYEEALGKAIELAGNGGTPKSKTKH